jgi:hypothetical protein
MRCIGCLFVLALLFTGIASTQDSGLLAENTTVVTRTDIYGQEILVAEGLVTNNATTAFMGISLFAELYDSSDELVGEGFGYLVNACGTALVDYALQPGQSHSFAVTLEMYEEDAQIERVEIIPQATETQAQESVEESFAGITQVTAEEVVSLEWIDDEFLRYGVGCAGSVFTNLKWYEYDSVSQTATEITHPNTDQITDAMLRQTGLDEPLLFNRSFLSFAPNMRRMVYQTDLNALVTAEPDGSFKRVIFEDLYNRSLQGFIWLAQGNFVAYYFGAYGEPVYYVTANLEGRPISGSISVNAPSLTVPGATSDGLKVIVTGTFGDFTGYFLKSTVYELNDLLFETDELPGNNWPAPIFSRRVDGNAYIYIARPMEGEALLQCFDVQTKTLHDLTHLPLQLATDERAWMWLSPDASQLALAANGIHSGLWLVDFADIQSCP